MSPPKTIFWIATVLDTMRHRIHAAIAQSLILHKTWHYFVENCNETTNKQTSLQRSRAAYTWSMKFNRKRVGPIGYSRPNGGGPGGNHRPGLWGEMDAPSCFAMK